MHEMTGELGSFPGQKKSLYSRTLEYLESNLSNHFNMKEIPVFAFPTIAVTHVGVLDSVAANILSYGNRD